MNPGVLCACLYVHTDAYMHRMYGFTGVCDMSFSTLKEWREKQVWESFTCHSLAVTLEQGSYCGGLSIVT